MPKQTLQDISLEPEQIVRCFWNPFLAIKMMCESSCCTLSVPQIMAWLLFVAECLDNLEQLFRSEILEERGCQNPNCEN